MRGEERNPPYFYERQLHLMRRQERKNDSMKFWGLPRPPSHKKDISVPTQFQGYGSLVSDKEEIQLFKPETSRDGVGRVGMRAVQARGIVPSSILDLPAKSHQSPALQGDAVG